jgi:hypothetical protein
MQQYGVGKTLVRIRDTEHASPARPQLPQVGSVLQGLKLSRSARLCGFLRRSVVFGPIGQLSSPLLWYLFPTSSAAQPLIAGTVEVRSLCCDAALFQLCRRFAGYVSFEKVHRKWTRISFAIKKKMRLGAGRMGSFPSVLGPTAARARGKGADGCS